MNKSIELNNKAIKFLQKWENKNNPFYPAEMRYDRLSIQKILTEYKLKNKKFDCQNCPCREECVKI
jgi:hypothetical protein